MLVRHFRLSSCNLCRRRESAISHVCSVKPDFHVKKASFMKPDQPAVARGKWRQTNNPGLWRLPCFGRQHAQTRMHLYFYPPCSFINILDIR
jgi:hypothetical protein